MGSSRSRIGRGHCSIRWPAFARIERLARTRRLLLWDRFPDFCMRKSVLGHDISKTITEGHASFLRFWGRGAPIVALLVFFGGLPVMGLRVVAGA